MAVRARILLRNDSAKVPLNSAGVTNLVQPAVDPWGPDSRCRGDFLPTALINSDIDHTGALREAVIPLATASRSAADSLAVDLTYDGTAALSATRLEQIGTPADVAEASDWDRVSEEFVGLRGLGNVAWYPVASVPVALGDGAKFFTEAAAERQRQSQATVAMRVTEEFFGEAPNLAVLDGEILQITPTSMPAASVPGIVTCEFPATRLGFAFPSLFLLARTARSGSGVQVFRAD